MLKTRRKVSAIYNDFKSEIARIERFDNYNQREFSSGRLSRDHLHFLSASLFFRAYKNYENVIEDTFVLYCQNKPGRNGNLPKSFLLPRDSAHTKALLNFPRDFTDWSSPSTIISRSEMFLRNGFTYKPVFSIYLSKLQDYKKIRNYIAHKSDYAHNQYSKVVQSYHGALPLTIPEPGEYLNYISKTDPSKYILMEIFEALKDIVDRIT